MQMASLHPNEILHSVSHYKDGFCGRFHLGSNGTSMYMREIVESIPMVTGKLDNDKLIRNNYVRKDDGILQCESNSVILIFFNLRLCMLSGDPDCSRTAAIIIEGDHIVEEKMKVPLEIEI